jgi:hypothetical protein
MPAEPVARVWLFDFDRDAVPEAPPVDLDAPAGVLAGGSGCMFGEVTAAVDGRAVSVEIGVRPTRSPGSPEPRRYLPPIAVFGREAAAAGVPGVACERSIGPDPQAWPPELLLGYLFTGRDSLFGRITVPLGDRHAAFRAVIAPARPGASPWDSWT